jgi:hypothetical protein
MQGEGTNEYDILRDRRTFCNAKSIFVWRCGGFEVLNVGQATIRTDPAIVDVGKA